MILVCAWFECREDFPQKKLGGINNFLAHSITHTLQYKNEVNVVESYFISYFTMTAKYWDLKNICAFTYNTRNDYVSAFLLKNHERMRRMFFGNTVFRSGIGLSLYCRNQKKIKGVDIGPRSTFLWELFGTIIS